jgi:glycosyltransferase involved in cell wall biosynthesis
MFAKMSQIPKISVIIPTYNHGGYVGKAINSVLNQTYKDYEIIVVDDGSTDNTRRLIDAYGNQIKYIYQENQGLASARNTGIQASQAKYVAFLDADDWFAEDNLQIKMSFMESHPDAVWVYSDWQYLDDKGNYLEKGSTIFKYAQKRLTGHIFEELVYSRNFVSPCTVVVKKAILEDVGYFDPEVICQEDLDLWLRISLKYPAHYIDKALVYVTALPGSLSRDFSKWVSGNAVIVDKVKHLIPDDLKNRGRILDKIIADKHTFLGRDFFQKGQFDKAINEFWQSIRHLPFQKRIYWLMLMAIIRLVSAYFYPSPTSEKSGR